MTRRELVGSSLAVALVSGLMHLDDAAPFPGRSAGSLAIAPKQFKASSNEQFEAVAWALGRYGIDVSFLVVRELVTISPVI